MRQFLEMLIDLEGEIFKDGFYKAFVFLEGPCHYNTILRQQDEITPCTECAKIKGNACRFGMRARPSMEGCGIDVYQTARNNGFFLQPLREKTETQNLYCLMLVD
jgi:predicted metal-binding protein